MIANTKFRNTIKIRCYPLSLYIILNRLPVFLILLFLFGMTQETNSFLYGQGPSSKLFRSRPEREETNNFKPASTGTAIQQEYPAIAKIVGKGDINIQSAEHKETQAIYFGSGCYVAELNDYGIVLTNWHVVSDSRTIQVIFPNFSSEAIVLLADETWDLAALVIRKPPFLPIPISLEDPQSGDELWVGGYGYESGLNDFQMKSGKVNQYTYSMLDTEKDLPAETISIEAGVREGDSGGPVFNRYGELSGILWGTTGQETMCTFCLRIQAFLTQAQYQLINSDQNLETFFASMRSGKNIKKMLRVTTPAKTALQTSGIYPISMRPIYISASSNKNPADGGIVPSVSGIPLRHPPYPAFESPTFFKQREVIGRPHPEVYPETAPYLKKKSKVTYAFNSRAIQEENTSQIPVSGEKEIPSPDKAPEKLKVTQTSQKENTAVQAKISSEEKDSSKSSKDDKKLSEKEADEKNFFHNLKMNDVQMVIASVLLLFLFFNSLRFLAIAGEK